MHVLEQRESRKQTDEQYWRYLSHVCVEWSSLCGRGKTEGRNANCQLSHLGVRVQQHASRIIDAQISQQFGTGCSWKHTYTDIVREWKSLLTVLCWVKNDFKTAVIPGGFLNCKITHKRLFIPMLPSLLLWWHLCTLLLLLLLLLARNPLFLVHLFLLSKDAALSASLWGEKYSWGVMEPSLQI